MLRRAIIGLLLLLLLPISAWAQGALLQGGAPITGQAPMYSGPPGGSQAVVQASGPAGGGDIGLGLTELLQVNRVAGTGPDGSHVCLYDNPVTHVGGYHFFCMEAGANSKALMAVGNGGGAAPQPFQFCINGVCYDFPFSIGGILGPNTTTIGHVAIWNNTTGSLLADNGPGLTLAGNLTAVNGTFSGALAAGATTVTGPLTVSGLLASGTHTVTGNLTVSGTGAFSGAVATGALSATGGITATGALSSASISTGALSAAAGTFSGAVSMAGLSATTGNFSGAVSTGTLTVAGDIGASGVIGGGSFTTAGGLTVSGGSILSGSLLVGGTFNVNGVSGVQTLGVAGNLGVVGTVSMANATITMPGLPTSSGGFCVGITNTGQLYVSGVTC